MTKLYPVCRAIACLTLASATSHAAEVLFFEDDFSRPLAANWVVETPHIDRVNGAVRSLENGTSLVTLADFTGNLRIEVDVIKEGEEGHGCWDFYVELDALGAAGALLFDTSEGDAIDVGVLNQNLCGDRDALPAESPNRGTMVLTYIEPFLQLTFTNSDRDAVSTRSVEVGSFTSTRIRLHLAAFPDSPRFVDNFKVFGLVPLCAGRRPTIVGSSGDDVLRGTDGKDVIVGRGGNDLIYGGGGPDTICGGDGVDVIFGGRGNDRLYGEDGDDVLHGEDRNDRLFGGPGRDSLSGGPGNDRLVGDAGNDTLSGDEGNDQLDGGDGADACDRRDGAASRRGCEALSGGDQHTAAGSDGGPPRG